MKYKKTNKLSVVIPILNEEKNILPLTLSLLNNLKNFDYEIIFVDDHSSDNSIKVLKILKKKYKFFNPLIRKKSRDLSQSCFDGIKKAKFSNVLIMDGDLQHDPKYINKMYHEYKKEKCDIVIGARNLLAGSGSSSSAMIAFGGLAPAVAITESWDGTSWTEVADLATGRRELGGSSNGTSQLGLAFSGCIANGTVQASTEEFTQALATVSFDTD